MLPYIGLTILPIFSKVHPPPSLPNVVLEFDPRLTWTYFFIQGGVQHFLFPDFLRFIENFQATLHSTHVRFLLDKPKPFLISSFLYVVRRQIQVSASL